MKYNPLTRRQFLHGLGGMTLTLPFLPSLWNKAYAAPVFPKRFVGVYTPNGQRNDIWYNSAVTGIPTVGYEALEAQLTTIPGSLAPILGTAFDQLRNKLLLIRGLDVIPQLGHCSGSMLACSQVSRRVSIDQVLASSNVIYPGVPPVRSLHVTPGYVASSPCFAQVGGSVVGVPPITSPVGAFSKVFQFNGIAEADKSARLTSEQKVIDAVAQDYRKVMGHRRIGSEDKQRLEAHVDFINDLENRLLSSFELSTCPTGLTRDSLSSGGINDASVSQFIDIIVAAIKCGATKVATMAIYEVPGYGAGDWHGWSHEPGENGRAPSLAINSWVAKKVAELMTKLNVVEDPTTGQTYLDNSIVMWGNEMGDGKAHLQMSQPVLIGGSAGGFLKTGRYIDYRNRRGINRGPYGPIGRPYNEVLITILQAMGLQPSDYEKPGEPGFGTYETASVVDRANYQVGDKRSVLPGIRA